MRSPVVVLPIWVLAGAALSMFPAGASASSAGAAADKDCSDFDTQKQAQQFFESHNPSQDPHRLDADGDGIACESNPCPCQKPGGGGGGGGGGDNGTKKKRNVGRVKRIVDGDTVEVKVAGKRRTVRLVGMDTPERGQCGFDEAKSALRRQLRRGEKVKLKKDPRQGNKDRFGRWLRYVHDGSVDTGLRQVKRGFAEVLVVGGGFERKRTYQRAENEARADDRGVWALCEGF
jgi:endonuclease YncB( thermonuclease family)